MADFVQTMKDLRRMCDACQIEKGGACGCYPAGHYATCSMKEIGKEADLACDNHYFERLEKVITAWAAEHPEPVYPSWIDWLMVNGVIPDSYSVKHSMESGVRAATFYVTSKAFTPIPADIAQKLGIEPKEVER